MLTEHTLLTFLAYFPVYAFLGWCLEVIYASVRTGKFVNRGFLNGAVCPIYGLAAVIFIIFLNPIIDNLPLLYLASVLIASALELVGGFALEKLFHMRWWDYTHERFNIGGYVCLKFSILWGFVGIFLLKIVQPMINGIFHNLPASTMTIALVVFYLLFITDGIITVIAISHLNRDLQQVDELSRLIHRSSDILAENIGNFAINTSEKFDAKRDEISEEFMARKALYMQQKEELFKHHNLIRARLLKAFPNLKHDTKHHALDDMRKRYEAYRKK
ncbi:membrane protein [Lactococcus hodotermopsidis]|uniref:Membrane protein n=1 Tax=Pseudolactococcus hodotermopsidis TaxID=2709157 RepID=A0A6A0BFE7_9LACT|nr:putative ABC transporter permease [Lactococcus hodotermopsidis]GFH43068.1 membrane protein [Lactococcus hodotermopsidis]